MKIRKNLHIINNDLAIGESRNTSSENRHNACSRTYSLQQKKRMHTQLFIGDRHPITPKERQQAHSRLLKIQTIMNPVQLFNGNNKPITAEKRHQAHLRLLEIQQKNMNQKSSAQSTFFGDTHQTPDLIKALELSEKIIAADILTKLSHKRQ